MNWIGRKLQRRRVRCAACGKEYQKRDTVEVESELGAPKRYCAKCIKAPFGGKKKVRR